MNIDAKIFGGALDKINRVVPYLPNPAYPAVVVDVTAEKMRVANSMQYWQTAAPGVPDMQLVSDKAVYLAHLLAKAETVTYSATPSTNDFLFGAVAVSLVKPVTNFYVGIEEVLLKPVLVNDFTLAVPRKDFLAAVHTVEEGTHPRVIRLQVGRNGVIVTGKDANGNLVSAGVDGTYDGPEGEHFFPARELRVLASTIEDEHTSFKFSKGTKARPAPLLATDESSGLTVVLSPTHK